MNKKYLTIYAVVFTVLIFMAIGPIIAADVPDDIMICNEGYKSDKKGPAKLTHTKHAQEYEIACEKCHHEYRDGKNVWKENDPVKKCGECHYPLKKNGKAMKLRKAYHKNCKACHKESAKKGKPAPFKKCKKCHTKGEKSVVAAQP